MADFSCHASTFAIGSMYVSGLIPDSWSFGRCCSTNISTIGERIANTTAFFAQLDQPAITLMILRRMRQKTG